MVVVRLSGKRMGRSSWAFAGGSSRWPARRPRGAGQGHGREVVAVKVVFEVEDLREAGPRDGALAPAAIVARGGAEVLDAGPNGRAARLAGGEQAEQCPGGLRGRHRALARQRRV